MPDWGAIFHGNRCGQRQISLQLCFGSTQNNTDDTGQAVNKNRRGEDLMQGCRDLWPQQRKQYSKYFRCTVRADLPSFTARYAGLAACCMREKKKKKRISRCTRTAWAKTCLFLAVSGMALKNDFPYLWCASDKESPEEAGGGFSLTSWSCRSPGVLFLFANFLRW